VQDFKWRTSTLLAQNRKMFNQQSALKKKSYISCQKIASFRRGMKRTEKGRKSSSSYTFFVFEHENSLTFSSRYRSNDFDGGLTFNDHFKYCLKLRTLKSGEKTFIFYKMNPSPLTGVRTSCPNHLRSKLASLCEAQEASRTKRVHKDTSRGLYMAQERRLLASLKAFLRRHGIDVRHLSGDPFSLMTQLCYPGTQEFDDKTLRKISVGKFLLKNPVQLILRTKGKKSKRVLFNAIKTHPFAAQGVLRTAKYIRINRSLDHAQQFLEKVAALEANNVIRDSPYYDDSIKNLSAKSMKIFDRLSIDEIISSFGQRTVIHDTFNMIRMLNAGEGFDLSQIQYRSIGELHDALAVLMPRKHKKSFQHFQFKENNAAMQFCKTLQENFTDNRYSICYASSTEELHGQAQVMRNCAFYYYAKIEEENYAIFCIKEEGRLRYMFGVHIYYRRDVKAMMARVDQAVGVCNAAIEPELKQELNAKIKEALPSIIYDY
jgi:hypothetical protein